MYSDKIQFMQKTGMPEDLFNEINDIDKCSSYGFDPLFFDTCIGYIVILIGTLKWIADR